MFRILHATHVINLLSMKHWYRPMDSLPEMKIQSFVMQMDCQVKFHSPQNISGTSQQNSAAAFSWTAEADGDLF